MMQKSRNKLTAKSSIQVKKNTATKKKKQKKKKRGKLIIVSI